ncbi:PREDICTED: piggyBac transposable element-derived protein 3-like [Diuraphis noxia]|uniref:piggyBac transposable element-derived protein 3-like n=1 Tax=Diuraphis noxia TaxID=143948 RepID=UPI0007635F05|nr:PREDICTED: piggyBac transposable element-derived protein 3-like [Diuraphis noxia]
MAYHTNLYVIQKCITRFKPTDMHEVKRLIGIHIIMSNLKYPRVRLYRQKHFEVNLVAQNMTRGRFFSLRNNLHIVDNNEIPNGNKDKFIKVRSLYTALQKKCNCLPIERNLCVDEQMVPFKGQLSIKQYMKGKPIKWGVKVFLLCVKSGTIYNILPFQGYYELDQDLIKTVGSGASVVLYLTQNVKPNRYFLFLGNFFSSFGLFERLQQLQIYAAGTIRTNWFANPPLLSDKEMRKLGRGTTFEVSTDVPGCNIGIVKWFDNKAVNLGSNFSASGEVDRVTRWDKKKNGLLILKGPK